MPESPQSRQRQIDNVSAEDLLKVKKHQTSTNGSLPVDQEWLLLAEFAIKFGWQAYLDAKQDKISLSEMLTLIEAGRRLDDFKHYQNAEASFIASVSANAKRAGNTFRDLTNKILNRTKPD